MTLVLNTIRIICGLLVLVFGLMGLGIFGWEPPVAGSEARPFQLAMQGTGYIFPMITLVYLAAGTSLIVDRYAALSAIILAPISFNILLYHLILGAGELPVAIFLIAINAFVFWLYRDTYRPLLKSRP